MSIYVPALSPNFFTSHWIHHPPCTLSHSVVSDSLWPMNSSPPGSSAHEILQARILERFSTSYSKIFSKTMDWTRVSCSSCFGRWILYHRTHWEAPKVPINCQQSDFSTCSSHISQTSHHFIFPLSHSLHLFHISYLQTLSLFFL